MSLTCHDNFVFAKNVMTFKTCPLVRIVCLCYAYVMLMLWVFSLAYASVCAYAYAYGYALVKTSLYIRSNKYSLKFPRLATVMI